MERGTLAPGIPSERKYSFKSMQMIYKLDYVTYTSKDGTECVLD